MDFHKRKRLELDKNLYLASLIRFKLWRQGPSTFEDQDEEGKKSPTQRERFVEEEISYTNKGRKT